MTRTALWIAAGVVLGLIVHLVIMLMLPALSPKDVWQKIPGIETANTITLLDPVTPGSPNPLALDPLFSYAICRIDLSRGPGEVVGDLPNTFWSVAVYARDGRVVYSTTNRSGTSGTLELGVFNSEQTQLLARQEIPVEEGLLIVQSPVDDIFALIRLAAPYPVVRARYREILSALTCRNIGS